MASSPDDGDVGDDARCRRCLGLPKWIFYAPALRREQLRTVLCDVHIVFEPYAEFSADVDARLVAETHVGFQAESISTHQVGPFMAVHADAMAQAMGEVLVIWPIARVGDHLARGSVNGL